MSETPRQVADKSGTPTGEDATDNKSDGAARSRPHPALLGSIAVVVIGIAAAIYFFGSGGPSDPTDPSNHEALTPTQSHERMIAVLRQIADRAAGQNPYLGSAHAENLERLLAARDDQVRGLESSQRELVEKLSPKQTEFEELERCAKRLKKTNAHLGQVLARTWNELRQLESSLWVKLLRLLHLLR